MLHLSGAQISKLDRSTIGEDVLAFLQERGVPVEMSLDGRIYAVSLGTRALKSVP
jgi:hypothetical protein